MENGFFFVEARGPLMVPGINMNKKLKKTTSWVMLLFILYRCVAIGKVFILYFIFHFQLQHMPEYFHWHKTDNTDVCSHYSLAG